MTPHHLLAAAVMSAPAAIAVAKLNYPETEVSKFKNNKNLKLPKGLVRVIINPDVAEEENHGVITVDTSLIHEATIKVVKLL